SSSSSSSSPSSYSSSFEWGTKVRGLLREAVDLLAAIRVFSLFFPQSAVSAFWRNARVRTRLQEVRAPASLCTAMDAQDEMPGSDLLDELTHMYSHLLSSPWIDVWESPSSPPLLRLTLGRTRQLLCACLLCGVASLWGFLPLLRSCSEEKEEGEEEEKDEDEEEEGEEREGRRRGRRLHGDEEERGRGRDRRVVSSLEHTSHASLVQAFDNFTFWALSFCEIFPNGAETPGLARDMRRAGLPRLLSAWRRAVSTLEEERVHHVEAALCSATCVREPPPSSASLSRILEPEERVSDARKDEREAGPRLHAEDEETVE
ncbi:hypothetical protein TGPRC2_426490, partial [Toxoplasma gondii TgCatPRC2]